MTPGGGALAALGLACARGGLPVLEGLSFRVEPGQALILRGRNGAGKTTLLRTLAGLIPPVGGRVDMPPGGAALSGHADGVKGALTVAENLRFWAGLHGRPWDEGVLAAFGLGSLRDRPAATLSAGQARRVGLARLGLTRRPVLLLDEPMASLDAAAAARVMAWLSEAHLARGGMAVLAAHGPLGLDAPELDLTAYRARVPDPADAAFL